MKLYGQQILMTQFVLSNKALRKVMDITLKDYEN